MFNLPENQSSEAERPPGWEIYLEYEYSIVSWIIVDMVIMNIMRRALIALQEVQRL